MIKAIIFDFDGVIVESVDIKTQAFADLFKNEGRHIVKQVVNYHLNNTGVSRFEKFRYIYKNFLKRTLDKTQFDFLCKEFAKLVIDKVVSSPYVKGAEKFLDNYRNKYRIFVVSATPQDEIEAIIRLRKMRHYFRGIYGSPLKKSKAVTRILKKKYLNPREVLYVGDALSDYKAAKSNRINFIARVSNNRSVFENIDCPKIKDLCNNLEKKIRSL